MPTIKEVADLAGVSVGTVSHVINGAVPVSDSLRLKVEGAIKQLDYHPNHVARSLKTSRTRTLGILVPDMTISFYPQVIRGAETAARQRGYSLIAVNSDDDGERQRALLSLLRSQRVEGILLVVANAPAPITQIFRMIEAGISVVCLDRVPEGVPVDSVSVDDLAAASMGVEHLISKGHRRIALVSGPLTLKNERRRLLGYKRALRRAGITPSNDLIWQDHLRPTDLPAMCRERLRDPESRPDAFLCTNGPIGLGVLRGLKACGLKIPNDVAFVTFDELTVDDLFTPAITTIVQPAYEIGFRASEILLQRISEKSAPDNLISLQLPATLKVRESSRLKNRQTAKPGAGVGGLAR